MEKILHNIEDYITYIINDGALRLIISKPAKKEEKYKKITVEKIGVCYHISKYTKTQVFHENIKDEEIVGWCTEIIKERYQQINAWSENTEYSVLSSKKGKCTFKKTGKKLQQPITANSHNRKKNYILEEGSLIPPLTDMGIFTKEGKVVNGMYDKYKQINRYLEIIDDAVKDLKKETLNIIDFGCGKSYLTFVVYYYLTEIKKIDANIMGLDLKADVIEKCNQAAEKYGYSGLKFEIGDINGFKTPFETDIVMTLHACDTATDYALFNAVKWGAKIIFSVPCCQHEFNKQIETDKFSALTRYGIISERFSALATDAVRANLLEYCGYKTQLLEFIDISHTPKNILIRAVKKQECNLKHKAKVLEEVQSLMNEFSFNPTFYNLLREEGYIS